MFAFLFKLIGGIVLFLAGRSFKDGRLAQLRGFPAKAISLFARGFGIFFVLLAFIGTSMIWISSGQIGTVKRVYFGTSLQPGQIVALDGQLGPQARIITAGFHFEPFLTLFNKVEHVDVYTVPNGECAIMSAKDGLPITSGSAFAPPWPQDVLSRMVNDATYFLTEGKGQRGPQTTVLTPGSYTINPFLWEQPHLVPATRIEQGTVGVIKSSVQAPVDFGPFKRSLSPGGRLRVLDAERLPDEVMAALLVPVGDIGVWEEPLPNGLYYINTDAYKVTNVPTVAQVCEYKGGYKRRTIDIQIGDKGQITERSSEVEVQVVPELADTAIFTNPEGWYVAQELRALVQISPEMAPLVVATLGLTQTNAVETIENRVVTPIIRSVVRGVLGGEQIPFQQLKAVTDTSGTVKVNADGQPITRMAHEFRAVRVLDLLENRSSLEDAIERRARPEMLKEGVTLNEIRLAESAIPPELLIARKREQLARQLKEAWHQEQLAQVQRKTTENARATADQQPELVKSEIQAAAAENRKKARTTEGDGEKSYLLAVAEGQKAQAGVLGQQITAQLQMFQQFLKAISDLVEKNPDILTKGLENASKFVPDVLVTNSGGGNGLEGAAAVLGKMLGGRGGVSIPTLPNPAESTLVTAK